MLFAAYVNPQGARFSRDDVTNSFPTLFDEFSCAAQVALHFLLRGDHDAKIGGLSEISDAHGGLVTTYPALLNAQLLIDFASAAECIIGTGRVQGDDGQPTFVGSIGQKVASRPDHVLMSSRVYQASESAHILPVKHISDHCVLGTNFRVDDAGRGCGSRMVLKWNPEHAKECAEVLADKKEIQEQFEQAVDEGDHEEACFCLHSMIVHAATDFRVGMSKNTIVCAPLRAGRTGSRNPPWFDAVCKQKRKFFREALQSGQAEHACKLYSKNPELHAMLRQPKHPQITPLAEPAWFAFLTEHFVPLHIKNHSVLIMGAKVFLPAREIAVPLGRNHPPPDVLLRQGACADWIPEPDS
eukprot:1161485-Pelagomonas_calceolata.AAC.3